MNRKESACEVALFDVRLCHWLTGLWHILEWMDHSNFAWIGFRRGFLLLKSGFDLQP
jgi:hypothetical protein